MIRTRSECEIVIILGFNVFEFWSIDCDFWNVANLLNLIENYSTKRDGMVNYDTFMRNYIGVEKLAIN